LAGFGFQMAVADAFGGVAGGAFDAHQVPFGVAQGAVQVAQVGDLAAAAHHAGHRQEAAAGADAGHVERGYFGDAEARGAGGP
jgi:hypothetical protein